MEVTVKTNITAYQKIIDDNKSQNGHPNPKNNSSIRSIKDQSNSQSTKINSNNKSNNNSDSGLKNSIDKSSSSRMNQPSTKRTSSGKPNYGRVYGKQNTNNNGKSQIKPIIDKFNTSSMHRPTTQQTMYGKSNDNNRPNNNVNTGLKNYYSSSMQQAPTKATTRTKPNKPDKRLNDDRNPGAKSSIADSGLPKSIDSSSSSSRDQSKTLFTNSVKPNNNGRTSCNNRLHNYSNSGVKDSISEFNSSSKHKPTTQPTSNEKPNYKSTCGNNRPNNDCDSGLQKSIIKSSSSTMHQPKTVPTRTANHNNKTVYNNNRPIKEIHSSPMHQSNPHQSNIDSHTHYTSIQNNKRDLQRENTHKEYLNYDISEKGHNKPINNSDSRLHGSFSKQIRSSPIPQPYAESTKNVNAGYCKQNDYCHSLSVLKRPPPQTEAYADALNMHHGNTSTRQDQSYLLNIALEKIEKIRMDVFELENEINDFKGNRNDKYYIYLFEMLTRNLLKLDNIEIDGYNDIRIKKRDVIKFIQNCTSQLEENAIKFEKSDLSKNQAKSQAITQSKFKFRENQGENIVNENNEPGFYTNVIYTNYEDSGLQKSIDKSSSSTMYQPKALPSSVAKHNNEIIYYNNRLNNNSDSQFQKSIEEISSSSMQQPTPQGSSIDSHAQHIPNIKTDIGLKNSILDTSALQGQTIQDKNVRTNQELHSLFNMTYEKINKIQTEVLELKKYIEVFKGSRKDKNYIYLDEMLLNNLLKLDNIESDGNQDIRLKKRQIITCIKSCINKLEENAFEFEELQENKSIKTIQSDQEKKTEVLMESTHKENLNYNISEQDRNKPNNKSDSRSNLISASPILQPYVESTKNVICNKDVNVGYCKQNDYCNSVPKRVQPQTKTYAEALNIHTGNICQGKSSLLNIALEKIETIRTDVLEFRNEIYDFKGKLNDKKYIYLVEMLTRNRVKLDNVETDGYDDVRIKKINVIQFIQNCMSKLEANAIKFEKSDMPKSQANPQDIERSAFKFGENQENTVNENNELGLHTNISNQIRNPTQTHQNLQTPQLQTEQHVYKNEELVVSKQSLEDKIMLPAIKNSNLEWKISNIGDSILV